MTLTFLSDFINLIPPTPQVPEKNTHTLECMIKRKYINIFFYYYYDDYKY